MGEVESSYIQNNQKAHSRLLSYVLQDFSIVYTLFLLLLYDAGTFRKWWTVIFGVSIHHFWNSDDGRKTARKNILVLCHRLHLGAYNSLVFSSALNLERIRRIRTKRS